MPTPLKLFISYRSLDSDKVDPIVRYLASLTYEDGTPRYSLWQDKKDMPVGDWWDSIVDAIIDCQIFVFHISQESLKSEVCKQELAYARARNRFIIPVVLPGEFYRSEQKRKYDIRYWSLVPPALNDYRTQFLFFTEDNFYQQFEAEVQRYEKKPPPDYDAERPLNPDGSGLTNDTLYEEACDYARRMAFDEAEKRFRRLAEGRDHYYEAIAPQWMEILRRYHRLVWLDDTQDAIIRLPDLWTEYTKLFPKPFLKGIFDPKGIAAHLHNKGEMFSIQNETPVTVFTSSVVRPRFPEPPDEEVETQTAAPFFNIFEAIDGYHTAFDEEQWEMAQAILDEIRDSGVKLPRTFKLADSQSDLDAVLDAQKQRRKEELLVKEREQEYNVLRRMAHAKRPNASRIWAALQVFWEVYPDYDPDTLARFGSLPLAPTHSRSRDLMPDPFAWIDIPAGKVTLEAGGYVPDGGQTFNVPAFAIAKYPVTNAQFALFIQAGGYHEKRWWTSAGWEARENGWAWIDSKWQPTSNDWTEPRFWQDNIWNGPDQPVVGISWYEAIAFCQWLSEMSSENILLPTEQQWQRAAQGDDGRTFPWGYEWDGVRCNNSVKPFESNQTTPVTYYQGKNKGDSPYGVVDMAGNVWDWCATSYRDGNVNIDDDVEYRVLRGGSWHLKDDASFCTSYRYGDTPLFAYGSRGFRIARS